MYLYYIIYIYISQTIPITYLIWKFRSQSSDLWTDEATVVRAVREENMSEEKKSEKRQTE